MIFILDTDQCSKLKLLLYIICILIVNNICLFTMLRFVLCKITYYLFVRRLKI